MAKALQSKAEKAEAARCPLCWKQPGQDVVLFQNKRHQHYLTFPHGKVLEAHLLEQYGEERVKDGGIKAIMNWYYGKKDEEWKATQDMVLGKKPTGFASDAREPKDAPEPVWNDDRED